MASALSLLQLGGGKRLPVITQAEAAECGLACLAMVAGYHGLETDLGTLRRRVPISAKGMTLHSVLVAAQRLGLTGRGLRLEPEALGQIRLPAILHWDMNHFVVLKSVRGGKATIHDPARGARRMTLAELGKHFTGVALELTPTNAFKRGREIRRLKLSELVGRVDGAGRAVAMALLLSMMLQVFVLASPFYMQLAVDQAVLQGDQGLLTALAIGFLLLTGIKLAADFIRARVLLALSQVIGFQAVVNLFHHLVRLPVEWFARRHIGDLVSRFNATKPITELLSQGLVAVLVDGLMAVLTLAMILLYSPTLAAIVLAALVLHVAVRIGGYRMLRAREEEVIEAEAREQTTFIETARAMQTIRLFGREADREALWQGRQADVVNREGALGRAREGFRGAKELVTGLETILVVYVGARLAIAGELTIGMLFAFMAYRQQFIDKTTALVDIAVRFRLLDLHLQRIADIAHAEREPGLEAEATAPLVTRPFAGRVELRGVTFRHAEAEPEVLSGVDLAVAPGEFLAITGPSGGGKTTLLKLMLGLLTPQSGQVLVDGRPLDAAGMAAFRAQAGVVMQDDALLAGSIAENITFFDPQPDLAWMRECAVLAGVDEEVMAMPMTYSTLVGDLGTALSGGQRQRLLLARALYRRPKILMMDEGTSHLDVAKEREVNAALAALDITRIVIAHRPETIAAADRVVVLRDGALHEAARVPVLAAAS
ncbi:MAG TPA: peptidase domain-containing ABC transporter [Falsiroseomonas sp.]|jgi:ATP-binding cassette subfamily B protein RaxB|nr:peptidase domain-containing ABC transporter [Falsiroseomonas sp.]